MNFIKKHIKGIIAIVVLIIILVILLLLVGTLMPDTKKSSWGNRVSDIKSHPINDEEIVSVKEALKGHQSVEEVTYRLSGRTINFIITVATGTGRSKAESLVTDIATNLSDDVKGYYDIQVFYKSKDSEDTTYPFMGYKNKISSNFSFTKE